MPRRSKQPRSETRMRGRHQRRRGREIFNMKPYVPIGCADYEYIEIACMHRYQVDIVRHDATVRGLAVTTETNPTGEYLILESDDGQRVPTRVDQIKQIIVLAEDRYFDERTFEPLVDAG